jgi:mRNA interferase MazF
MIRRGDVVIVDFPFPDTGQSKIRPALIVQNDRDNQKLRKTVIAMITSNLRRRNDSSHLYVDPNTPDGISSGLSFPSLVSCNNLFTITQNSVQQVIGHLSDTLKRQLADRLKAALELP